MLKPQIKFPMFPIIYKWIEADYDKCVTYEEFVEFTFRCQKESEETKNKAKKMAYDATFQTMYQIITGHSYSSSISNYLG